MSTEHPCGSPPYHYLSVDEVLERVDGDLELLTELHQMFRHSWRDSWNSICQQITKRNLAESKEEIHSFKGTVGMLSSGSPFQLLKLLEKLVGDAYWEESNTLIEPLSKQVAQLDLETESFLRECANELSLPAEQTAAEQLV